MKRTYEESPGSMVPSKKLKEDDDDVIEIQDSDSDDVIVTPTIPVPVTSVKKFELSKTQKLAVVFASTEGKNIFVTGNAGTGKSATIYAIVEDLQKNVYGSTSAVAVTAPTGIAAFNIGGRTIHSWAGLVFGNDSMSIEKEAGIIMSSPMLLANWTKTKTLIIDEISMVSAKMLNRLNELGKVILRCERPFGGIQVIFSGDLLQLPPVSEKGKPKELYPFESYTWKDLNLHPINLVEQYRQLEDTHFSRVLNNIRLANLNSETLDALKSCMNRVFTFENDEDSEIEPTILYSKKVDVENENEKKLGALNAKLYVFPAQDSGTLQALKNLNSVCMAPEQLKLKVGAQVVLLRNLEVDSGLVNGARGVVIGFESTQSGGIGSPIVKFFGIQETKVIHQSEWTIKDANEKVIARRYQLPLTLAWALTTHKCQGMTLDLVETTLEGIFEPGQAYVALSRCKTLKGLRLVGHLQTYRIKAHPLALKYYKCLEPLNTIK